MANDDYEVTVAELLTEATRDEIERRDGEWDAFSSSVFCRLDQGAIAEQRADLEAQTIALLKHDIDVELSEMSPQFEEAFRDEIESRIFQSAIEPTWRTRLRSWFERARPQLGFGVGWAGAAAAAVGLVLAIGSIQSPGERVQGSLLSGHVAVQQISFEGDVTVLPDDGVTIIWLDDAAS